MRKPSVGITVLLCAFFQSMAAQTKDNPLQLGIGIKPPEALASPDWDLRSVLNDDHLHSCDVTTRFVVDEHGHVYKPETISSSDTRCSDVILSGMSQYRFLSAKKDGKSVAVQLKIAFHINLTIR